MKARVISRINKRLWPSTRNTPLPYPLNPNDIIEVLEEVEGEAVTPTNNKWYKTDRGFYVWSGGVDLKANREVDITYWTTFFGLNLLAQTYEEQLRTSSVSILDTGISILNPDLDNVVNKSRNFFFPNRSVTDFDGHGTYCAGILAANGNSKIIGGTSGAKLNVGKILTSSQAGLTGLTEGVMIASLDWAAQISDVISVSAGLPTCTDALKSKVADLANRKKIIIAAIGNVGETGSGNYPAILEGCISVGALNNSFEISDVTLRENKIDICVPGENIVSTLPNELGSYGSKTGTSVSTPLVASMVHLMKLKDNSLDIHRVRTKLANLSDVKSSNQFKYLAIKPNHITI